MSNKSQGVLAVLSLASFMASLDLFIVNVAFDDIGQDFSGHSLSDLSWILSAYAIVYAALLVPLGRLADRYGRKAGFLSGLALFTGASVLCAASPNLWLLVAFRVLQAAGAAALTPTSLGLLLAATPAERRQGAVRVWAATGALAAALGPVVGGVLVELSWRWVFLVNLPVGVVALVVAIRIVPDSREAGATRLPDLAGAGLLAVSVGALALGIVEGPTWGWVSARTGAAVVLALITGAVFARRTATHNSPVVEPALLKVTTFAWANVTALVFSITFAAALLELILWLQQVWHYSAVRTGLAVAPGPAMVPIFAAISHRIKVPVGRLISLGCVLLGGGGLYLLANVGPKANYLTEVLPGWMIGGIGVGLALPAMLAIGTASLPPDRAATGSAVVNMSRQIGTVLGVSLLVAVLGSPTSYDQAHTAFTRAWVIFAVIAGAAAVSAVRMSPRVLATRQA